LKKFAWVRLGISAVCLLLAAAQAKDITGKVVAVYHEPVTVNGKTLDKVSVSLSNCATGQWETFSYSPGGVSDDNSLGFLYRDLANAGRSMVSKSQYMTSVSGHATLVVNEQNVIQKTTFWGYNWECGKDIEGKPSAASAPAGGGATTPAAQPAGGGGAANPLGKFKKLGF